MNEHQDFEKDWWGNCCNTYGEEEKQLTYAKHLGLTLFHNAKSPYNINLEGKSVIDIGGGPSSLLLKCCKGTGTVIDPCDYPKWVEDRYRTAGIIYIKDNAEVTQNITSDEVWIYNVLQHTEDPEQIVKNMKKYGKLLRVFEWIDTKQTLGHPHILTKDKLDLWFGGDGKVTTLKQPCLIGNAYHGIFKGDRFEH